MTTTQKINEASEKIGAAKAADGNGYIYFAEETREWYRVTRQELIELSDMMHDEDETIALDAYSHWCNQTGELIGDDAKARELGLIEA